MKIEFRLDKRESSAKKRNAGGVNIKLESAFSKVKNTVYGHGDDTMIMTGKLNMCTTVYILHKTEGYCRQCKSQFE